MNKILFIIGTLLYTHSITCWTLTVINEGSSPAFVQVRTDNKTGINSNNAAVILPNTDQRWNERKRQEESKGVEVVTSNKQWSFGNSLFADVYVDLPGGGQSKEGHIGNGVFSPRNYKVIIKNNGTNTYQD